MKRLISLILALCFAFSIFAGSFVTSAEDGISYSLDSEREEIEQKLKAVDSKLSQLGKESKETEEYISTLDDKIKYLNRQYSVSKNEAKEIENKVASLEGSIASNETELETIKGDISSLEENIDRLNEEFSSTYKDYSARIRAIYISGNTGSALTFLLTSGGISNLLTRYEMVRAISKKDGALLEAVKTQTAVIVKEKNKLDSKKTELGKTQDKLKSDKANLKTEKTSLLQKQEDMEKQQAKIEEQQLEANELLEKLHKQTQEYGEYRNITQEELDAIDAEIEAAAKKYAHKTTTTTTTTTKKHTTTTTTTTTTTEAPTEEDGTTKKPSTTKRPTTTTTTTTKPSSNYISLTYPCPSYKKITCGFGAYSGHSGCDFSTKGKENQKIVAAESGTVILVKLLETSYGHYVVIAHDKTTSSGKTVYTLYAHNNDIIVSEGQYVKKGQQIAYSGTTGNSTGPHCHFEVRIGGSSQRYAVNPANYLP